MLMISVSIQEVKDQAVIEASATIKIPTSYRVLCWPTPVSTRLSTRPENVPAWVSGNGIHLSSVGSSADGPALSAREVPTPVQPDARRRKLRIRKSMWAACVCQGNPDYGQVYRELDAQMEKSLLGYGFSPYRPPWMSPVLAE